MLEAGDRVTRTFLFGITWLAAVLGGCASVITPHQAYTPLLDHAGQVDLSARAGLASPGGLGATANVAYAPIDHLEFVGGFDGTIGDDTSHYSGMLGVGTFVRHDIFRLEVIAGGYGGYAQGWLQTVLLDPMGVSREIHSALKGPFALPYGLAMIGFEFEVIEIAVGGRAFGWFGSLSYDTGSPGSAGHSDYERFYVEPLATARLVFGPVRLDLAAGFAANVLGDPGPVPSTIERNLMWHVDVGLGYQFDTIERQAPASSDPESTPSERAQPTVQTHG